MTGSVQRLEFIFDITEIQHKLNWLCYGSRVCDRNGRFGGIFGGITVKRHCGNITQHNILSVEIHANQRI